MSNSFSLVLSASSLLLKQIKQHTKEVITLSLDYKLVTIAAVMKTVLNRKRHEDLCGNIFVFCFSLSRVWSFYKSDGGTNRNDNLPLKLSTDSSAVPSHIHGFLYRQLENSTCITDVQISNAVHVRKGLGRVIKMSFLFWQIRCAIPQCVTSKAMREETKKNPITILLITIWQFTENWKAW